MSEEADFIVVGGGTAGCVMAASLSLRPDTRVLLIEAGDAPKSPFVSIPAGFSKLFGSSSDWAFSTTPQTPARRVVFAPRGKMLGGSSGLNAQIHQWGHPADFEGWREAGADGWGWEDVAPVFKGMERASGAPAGRGAEGPLPVEPLAVPQPQSRAFVDAVRALHGDQAAHYNGATYEGAWISEVNHERGRRVSAYDAWLKPALRRPNLKVMANATALSILFTGRRASGVQFAQGAREAALTARRGVIVCAGAYSSPHLLQCSGIGPGALLAQYGVRVLVDSPGVGANLHDHPMACLTFESRSRRSLKSAESPQNLINYLVRRQGMLASNVAEALAFFRTSAEMPAPDLELLFAPVEWREEGLKPPRVHGFTIAVIALTPKSRGSVSLVAPDVRTPPRIDPALLTDSSDRAVMAHGLALARRIAQTRPLLNDTGAEIAPGASCASAEAQQVWLNEAVQTVYHPAGTCRMGADASNVLTPRLAVRGVEGLWVADASAMPALTRGHPNAAVAMLAERGAQFIAAAMTP